MPSSDAFLNAVVAVGKSIEPHHRVFDRCADVIDQFGDFRFRILPRSRSLCIELSKLIDEQAMPALEPFDRSKVDQSVPVAFASRLFPQNYDSLRKHFDSELQTRMKGRCRHRFTSAPAGEHSGKTFPRSSRPSYQA